MKWCESAKNLKLHICEQNIKRDQKDENLDDKQLELIEAFLNWSDVLHMNVGRKDNVYIGKFNSEHKYKQKRYLVWMMRDLLNFINCIRGKEQDTERFSDVFEIDLSSHSYLITWKVINNIFLIRDISHGSCVFLIAHGYWKCFVYGERY